MPTRDEFDRAWLIARACGKAAKNVLDAVNSPPPHPLLKGFDPRPFNLRNAFADLTKGLKAWSEVSREVRDSLAKAAQSLRDGNRTADTVHGMVIAYSSDIFSALMNSRPALQEYILKCVAGMPVLYEADPQLIVDVFDEAVKRVNKVKPIDIDMRLAELSKESLLAIEKYGSGSDESHAPTAQRKSVCPIVLHGKNEEPTVYGKRKKRLTPTRYSVVEALVNAYPDRLSLSQLPEHGVKRLDDIRKIDDDWKAVISKPGNAHGGYGLNAEAPTNG